MEMREARTFLNARYWFLCMLFRVMISLGLCAVLAKAALLQIVEYTDWVNRGNAQSEATSRVPTYRGSIYDRHGRLMAYSVPQSSLFADGREVVDPAETAARLAPVLGEDPSSIRKKLVRERRFIWLKRYLTDEEAEGVAKLGLKGVHLTTEFKRFYPHRRLAGQILGFVDTDGIGLEGVEKSWDELLRANPRDVEQFRDGIKRRLFLEPSMPSGPGEHAGIRLTLDGYLQYLCECELEKAVTRYQARAGEVVVLDPETFEVLAMANWPPFDPNTEDKENANAWRNRAITDLFEPGSTFKVFLVAAAFEERLVEEKDRVFCENGKCRLAGHTINDVHPYGWLTIPEVIKHSSNIGAAKLAMQLGSEKYYGYIRGFGFGETTGIGLPGEVKGLVRPWERWRPIDLVTTGFGQSIGVTALQLTAAMARLANGGRSFQPLIVREVVDSSGRIVERFGARAHDQVVGKTTAQRITEMMVSVTQEGGTGTGAALGEYAVAGKTGTAQKVDPETGRYSSSKYTAIFTGFVPADRPRLVMTAVIHEPKGAIYGGVVAAPVFRNVAMQALPYMQVSPSGGEVDPYSGVRWVAAGFNKDRKGPESAAADGDPALMPDLTGLSLRMALQAVAPLKLKTRFDGSGMVVGQNPAPGSPVTTETVVELMLEGARN